MFSFMVVCELTYLPNFLLCVNTQAAQQKLAEQHRGQSHQQQEPEQQSQNPFGQVCGVQ
jgi:hypothetical protein